MLADGANGRVFVGKITKVGFETPLEGIRVGLVILRVNIVISTLFDPADGDLNAPSSTALEQPDNNATIRSVKKKCFIILSSKISAPTRGLARIYGL